MSPERRPLAVLIGAIILAAAVSATLFYYAVSLPEQLTIVVDRGPLEDLIGSPVLVAGAFLAVPGVTVQAGSVEVSEDSVIFVFNVTGLAEKYREEAAGGLGAPTVTISLYNPDRGASAIIRIGNYTHPVPGGLLKPDTVVIINSTVLSELRREGAVLLVSYNSAPEPPRSARNNLTTVQGLGGGLELMADKRLETVEPPDWWAASYNGGDPDGAWSRLVRWVLAAYYSAPKTGYPSSASAVETASAAAMRGLGLDESLPGFMVIPVEELVQALEPGARWQPPGSESSMSVVLPLLEVNVTSLSGGVMARVTVDAGGVTASGMVYSPALAVLAETRAPMMAGTINRVLTTEATSLRAGIGIGARLTMGQWALLVYWKVYDAGDTWLVRPEAVFARPYAVDYAGQPAEAYYGEPLPWDGLVPRGSLVPYMGRYGSIMLDNGLLVDYIYPQREGMQVVMAPVLSPAIMAPLPSSLEWNAGTLVHAGTGVAERIVVESFLVSPSLTGCVTLYHVGVSGEIGGLPPFVSRVDVSVGC